MCAKSWQTPRRKANDIGGVVVTVVALRVVDHVGLDPAHQVEGAVEHGASGRETLPRVIANFRIERHHAAGEQEMRRRHRPEIGGGGDRVALRLERGCRQRVRLGKRVHRDASGHLHRQPVMRLLQRHPGDAIAEEILALAQLRRLRRNLQ